MLLEFVLIYYHYCIHSTALFHCWVGLLLPKQILTKILFHRIPRRGLQDHLKVLNWNQFIKKHLGI